MIRVKQERKKEREREREREMDCHDGAPCESCRLTLWLRAGPSYAHTVEAPRIAEITL
jgi:hypothetical protein